MAAPNITFIADVDVTRDDLTFKLRVINLRHQMSFYNKNEIWSIEMILMDEHGNKIQAMVSKRNLYRFKNVVNDGMTFYIKGPNFAALKTECNDFSGSLFGFSFVDYQTVLSLTHPQDTSVDVMGLVVAITEIQQGHPEKSKHRLNIRIQDAKFMIPIRVQDNIGPLTLTMFEREGRYLLKQSAKEFVKKMIERGDDLGLYPGEINALKGLKLAFKISITKFNVSNKNNQYGIARISDDETLIEQLENKFAESQPSNSQSLDFGSVDLQSQDIKNLKDAVYGTDDNITPSIIDKNDTTSPMKILNTTPVLKRNLEEVFDLEMNDHLSTSKTPKLSPDGPGKQLLKVKLEKNDWFILFWDILIVVPFCNCMDNYFF
ncbi:unnamed protein product [Lactuca virosa]|uniref:Replication protein A 70 kDa DNA-binding subunit B/D first OB fold domain-containing protein n=1 Tax=Lactuca virosa TaxID=75947 RepID=A0AAU9LN99_9ASTR|nr:unnamed protein product [Lactuca virosa]